MPAFPTAESILLKINQAAGTLQSEDLSLSSNDKADYADIALSEARQEAITGQLFTYILSALNLDAEARGYFAEQCLRWANHHKHLELNTWTFAASEQQIAWTMLAKSIVPTVARLLAYWDLDGALAPDMPRGEFWFLPTMDATSGALQLPLPKVLDWLIDLYGTGPSTYQHRLGGEAAVNANAQETNVRILYNWRLGDLPRVANIHRMFPDEDDGMAGRGFEGTFDVGTLTGDEAFAAALAFVRRKRLTSQTLTRQIAFPDASHLAAILDGNGATAERERFVHALATRYAAPTARTIRHRLLIARAVQSGYQSLCSFLCPGVACTEKDASRNKVLQLVSLFTRVFDLTIDARNAFGRADEHAEDRQFEAALTPFEREDLLLAIVPSMKRVANFSVSTQWSRRFERMDPAEDLEDLMPTDPEQIEAFAQRAFFRLLREADEDRRVAAIVERLKTSSPWRTLEDQPFGVVRRIIHADGVSRHAVAMACERLLQIAATPMQTAEASLQLAIALLSRDTADRERDVPQRVEALLAAARERAEGSHLDPLRLSTEARHLLFKGEVKAAQVRYREALDACSSWGCGKLRGEIALNLLAIDVADGPLLYGEHTAHRKYHRNMVAFGMFEGDLHSLEDTAIWAHDFFWDEFYRPYKGTASIRRPRTVKAQQALSDLQHLIFGGSQAELAAWLEKHRKVLERERIKQVRHDSVLTRLIKALALYRRAEPTGGLAEGMRQFLHTLIDAWPGQVTLSDFKSQTPLMLAADDGEVELVRHLLAAGADVNAQDYLGRTALHAATSGRSSDCVALLLDAGPDTTRVTDGEAQSALHTAVRVGDVAIARQISYAFPALCNLANGYGRTPCQEATQLLHDLPSFSRFMEANHRMPPKVDALREIADLLAE